MTYEVRVFDYKTCDGHVIFKPCPRGIRSQSGKVYIGDDTCEECAYFGVKENKKVYCMDWEIENE